MNSSKIKAVIASSDIYKESVNNLKKMGLETFFSYSNQNVLSPLSKHTDMQLAKISDNKYVCAPECYEHYKLFFSKFNKELIKGNTYLSCNYPLDIAYNIIVTDNKAIHNFKYTDKTVKENIKSKEKINVSQGYTACTLCLISENAAITSDEGIKKVLLQNNFDVLLVNDDNILLPGFDHGFLGGASFMLSPSCLAVNGNIETHPDSERIKAFSSKHGVEIISLANDEIMDIGSVITIR